jgi:hypothetical protein
MHVGEMCLGVMWLIGVMALGVMAPEGNDPLPCLHLSCPPSWLA